MDLLPELERRRAFRALSEEALPEGALDRMLEAASLAPSCFNNQPWRLVVAEGASLEVLKASLPEANRWATRARAIVAVTVKPSLSCRLDEGRDYALFDAGLATMALALQGTREGVVAHPIAGYSVKGVRKALGIPNDYVVITLVVLGMRGDDELLSEQQRERETGPRERKPRSETVARGAWTFGT